MPDTELTVTEADRRALKKCPKGWFDSMHDSVYAIRCVEFRLRRLAERDLLERKLKGKWPSCNWVYRITATGKDLNNERR